MEGRLYLLPRARRRTHRGGSRRGVADGAAVRLAGVRNACRRYAGARYGGAGGRAPARIGPLTYFFRAVTMLGSTAVLVPAGMVLLARWVRVRRRAAVLFAITMAGAVLLDITLKEVFHRPRPQPFFELAKPRTASFPSGHALVSFCFWARRRRSPGGACGRRCGRVWQCWCC